MEKLAQRNPAQVLDVLQARLAFERTGVKLYDSIIGKIERGGEARFQPLLDELRDIRSEEKEHEEWLEEQIRDIGGNPTGQSEMASLELEEGSGIKNIIVDGQQKPLHLLHALLAAELADNAGWDLLVKLADEAGDTTTKLQFMKRLGEEAKHLAFVREAVVRAAELDVLGVEEEMPSSFGEVAVARLAKPAAIGGALGVLLLGIGAALASAFFIARPTAAFKARALGKTPKAAKLGLKAMARAPKTTALLGWHALRHAV